MYMTTGKCDSKYMNTDPAFSTSLPRFYALDSLSSKF